MLQKQTIVLVALLVLAVAALSTAEQRVQPDPSRAIVRETCKSLLAPQGNPMIEMCKNAIKAKLATSAFCAILKLCKLPALLGMFG